MNSGGPFHILLVECSVAIYEECSLWSLNELMELISNSVSLNRLHVTNWTLALLCSFCVVHKMILLVIALGSSLVDECGRENVYLLGFDILILTKFPV